jgi:hypothetical protein
MSDGVTLRGAGLDQTWLTNCQICLNNPQYSYPYKSPTTVAWTAGYSQWSSNLTLASANGLQAGSILGAYQLNSGLTLGSNSCGTCDPTLTGNDSL